MASVLTVKEVHQDRGTEIDESALVKRTRAWRVTIDNVVVDDFQVINSFSQVTGIFRYSPWVSINGNVDVTTRCVSLSAKQDGDGWKWLVTATYSTIRASGHFSPRQQRERSAMAQNPQHGGQQQPHTNPTLRPAVIRFTSQDIEEGLEFDAVDGKPVWNSVGDKFVPPPTRPITIKVITIERNESAHDWQVTSEFENRVNDRPMTIHAANGLQWTVGTKTCLCKSIHSELEHESGINFWKVTYTLHYREKTWVLELQNMGFNEIARPPLINAGALIHMQDGQGARVASPRLLEYDEVLFLIGIPNGFKWVSPRPMPRTLRFNRYLTIDLNRLLL